ncbi:hypothetical protein ACWIUH_12445, partial [Ursidibacter arcticus]
QEAEIRTRQTSGFFVPKICLSVLFTAIINSIDLTKLCREGGEYNTPLAQYYLLAIINSIGGGIIPTDFLRFSNLSAPIIWVI